MASTPWPRRVTWERRTSSRTNPSGVLEAVQQLSSAFGVAVLGTIFFSSFGGHLPTHALAITAWACLVPLAVAFMLLFALPMHAREEH